mmetsp:Transcript_25481/g.43446  ORF Transcript_25481/g.43446 Transcript_25481/m.43446 type:complete len:229 (+) Transcript_25481:573-1259(+)
MMVIDTSLQGRARSLMCVRRSARSGLPPLMHLAVHLTPLVQIVFHELMLFNSASAIIIKHIKHVLRIRQTVPQTKFSHCTHKLGNFHQSIPVLVILSEHSLGLLLRISVGLNAGIVLVVVFHKLLLLNGSAPVNINLRKDFCGILESLPHPQVLHGCHELINVQKAVAISIKFAKCIPRLVIIGGTTRSTIISCDGPWWLLVVLVMVTAKAILMVLADLSLRLRQRLV